MMVKIVKGDEQSVEIVHYNVSETFSDVVEWPGHFLV